MQKAEEAVPRILPGFYTPTTTWGVNENLSEFSSRYKLFQVSG